MSEFLSLLIAGVVTGSIYAVSATGLVLTYNTTGIFNFAHGAIGMILAYLFWQLWQGWHLPALVSLALVLLVAAPVFGAVLERVLMRPLHGASTNIRLAVTLGLLLVLVGAGGAIWSQSNTYAVPEFFNGHQVSVGGVNLSYEQVITIGVAVVGALLLRLFFKRTRTGVAMRAVVDDPGLASLSGASSGRISAYAWMIGVMFAALAGILLAPTTMVQLNLTELVITGYAAAVVGRLRSLPLTFLGAMALGIAYSLATGYVPADAVSDVTAALPMAMLFVVLLVIPEARLALAQVARFRPLPAARSSTTALGAAAVVGATAVLSVLLTGNNLLTLGNVLVFILLGLSLVLLSGYGGQISLCQFSFLGVGAVAMHWVGGSVLGLLAAFALCAAVGAVLATPALRLRGLYLALATLSFAVLMDNIFFNSSSIMGEAGTIAVGRPDIFGMRFTSNGSFDVLLGVVVALCIVGVGALRRSAFGRRLVAMRDSPAACSTVGASLTVTKLVVFSLSAGMAGLAGALYGGLQTTVGAAQFQFLYSISIFVAVTLAGTSLMSGAVMAGLLLAVGPVVGVHVPQVPNFTQLVLGAGVLAAVRNPVGIGRLHLEVADAWARRQGRKDSLRRQPGPPPAAGALSTQVR
ncbi:MAG TPA: ABC transporter permease [Acidimicrobiales bacterium]|nr:ABC transporter permease [Acidimicrobiales bacterium]